MFWKTTATTLPNIPEVMEWYDDKNGNIPEVMEWYDDKNDGVDYDGQVIIERW